MSKEFSIMPPSLIYSTTRHGNLHRHEVFYGTANRKKSIRDGLVVFLSPAMHNMSDNGVHYNRAFDIHLKQIGQKAWMEHYNKTVEDFIREYGRSYL